MFTTKFLRKGKPERAVGRATHRVHASVTIMGKVLQTDYHGPWHDCGPQRQSSVSAAWRIDRFGDRRVRDPTTEADLGVLADDTLRVGACLSFLFPGSGFDEGKMGGKLARDRGRWTVAY